jgi:hypothetical protein
LGSAASALAGVSNEAMAVASRLRINIVFIGCFPLTQG